MDEGDRQHEKQCEPRILIWLGISIFDDLPRFRINLSCRTSISNPFSRTNVSFPLSIETDDNFTLLNAEPTINRTFRGITID
jgi:hypothetical protein